MNANADTERVVYVERSDSQSDGHQRRHAAWYENPESISAVNALVVMAVFVGWAASLWLGGGSSQGFTVPLVKWHLPAPHEWSVLIPCVFTSMTFAVDVGALAWSGTRARHIDSTGFWDKWLAIAQLVVVLLVGFSQLTHLIPSTWNLVVGTVMMFIFSAVSVAATMSVWSIVDRSLKVGSPLRPS